MDPKLAALVASTNLRDISAPPIAEQIDRDADLSIDPVVLPKTEPLRSTTDPLAINFATPDIVGRLHHSKTSPALKWFALIFLGGPMVLMGIGIVATTWASDHGAMKTLLGTAFGVAMAVFWPYVIFVRARTAAAVAPLPP